MNTRPTVPKSVVSSSTTGALVLLDCEERWLRGEAGAAMKLAMQLVLAAAEVSEVTEMVPVEMAHINSCHYSGVMSLDFAEFLLADRVSFAVPTHTNASLISCSTPHLRPEDRSPVEVQGARRVMEIYEALGCTPMWTCAPYQQPDGRAKLGQHLIGSESNAVGFANSVLGARTNKYGDLLDVAGALVGRVPLAGLHTDAGRRATHVFDVSDIPSATRTDPTFPHLLGVVLGRAVGHGVGAIVGYESDCEDDLRAIAAAAAAAGGVGLFHVVGSTPEAPTLENVTRGQTPSDHTIVTADHLAEAAAVLTNASADEPLRAVCLGTPHFSVAECVETLDRLDGRRIAPSVTMLVTTSRAVAAELELRGLRNEFSEAGVDLVLDTCSYFPPHPSGLDGLTLTNSAKWAYYAPGLLGVPVGFESLERCVESAVAGRWIR